MTVGRDHALEMSAKWSSGKVLNLDILAGSSPVISTKDSNSNPKFPVKDEVVGPTPTEAAHSLIAHR